LPFPLGAGGRRNQLKLATVRQSSRVADKLKEIEEAKESLLRQEAAVEGQAAHNTTTPP
jgi:hypothetical protein